MRCATPDKATIRPAPANATFPSAPADASIALAQRSGSFLPSGTNGVTDETHETGHGRRCRADAVYQHGPGSKLRTRWTALAAGDPPLRFQLPPRCGNPHSSRAASRPTATARRRVPGRRRCRRTWRVSRLRWLRMWLRRMQQLQQRLQLVWLVEARPSSQLVWLR